MSFDAQGFFCISKLLLHIQTDNLYQIEEVILQPVKRRTTAYRHGARLKAVFGEKHLTEN